MSTSEQHARIIKMDQGQITIYKRKLKDGVSANWQARIKINGQSLQVKKSLGTDDKDKATIKSNQLYLDLLTRYKETGTTKTKPFEVVMVEWLATLGNEGKKQTTIDNFTESISRYALKYWMGVNVDSIKDNDILKFISWRKQQSKIPVADNTIGRDLVPIKSLFKYAKTQQYIKNELNFPTYSQQSKRRAAFTDEEWGTVTSNLDTWIQEGNGNVKRARTYLKYYILILGNTGIRAGTEAKHLTWANLAYQSIESNQVSNGAVAIMYFNNQSRMDNTLIIYINKGKVDQRIVVPPKIVNDYLIELKEYRTQELGQEPPSTEPIFCGASGKAVASYKKGFRAYLESFTPSLRLNLFGEARTPYSLRHTFATRMLRYGCNTRDLALNMGTSLKMLDKHYLHDNYEDYGKSFVHIVEKNNKVPVFYPE